MSYIAQSDIAIHQARLWRLNLIVWRLAASSNPIAGAPVIGDEVIIYPGACIIGKAPRPSSAPAESC